VHRFRRAEVEIIELYDPLVTLHDMAGPAAALFPVENDPKRSSSTEYPDP
jgi:hypothetical protein